MRKMAALTGLLAATVIGTGSWQLASNGWGHFVYREPGAGETGVPAAAAAAPARPHRPAAVQLEAAATVIVRAGDTLSQIAGRLWGSPDAWPALWYANRALVKNPDVITPGEVLNVPSGDAVTAAIAAAATAAIPAAVPAPAAAARPLAGTGSVSPAGFSGFEQCVITRESGGNPQVMNASGHYGLFQFSFSTWVEYGGNPADFGDASVAEQEQVFGNAMATPGGELNWSPYDGC
jgi:Transglycosylase-like domain/LysM domain